MPGVSWQQPSTGVPRRSSMFKQQKAQDSFADQSPEFLDPESPPKTPKKTQPTATLKKPPGLRRRTQPTTPYPSSDTQMRPARPSTSKLEFSAPIHPTTSGKQLPSTTTNAFDRRKTRSHTKKLQDMYPSPYIPWIDPGLRDSPKKKKATKNEYGPVYPPGYLGENTKISRQEFSLDLGEPAMEEEYMTSHIERNFDGVKVLWAREDWEENMDEVLKEEEIVREKRRKERKERERNGSLTKAQRKKRRLNRAEEIKREENEDMADDEAEGACWDEMGGDWISCDLEIYRSVMRDNEH